MMIQQCNAVNTIKIEGNYICPTVTQWVAVVHMELHFPKWDQSHRNFSDRKSIILRGYFVMQ